MSTKFRKLIETNLKEGGNLLYSNRDKFDYSITGTNKLETIFDRLRLTSGQRELVYAGYSIFLSNVRMHDRKVNLSFSLSPWMLRES